MSEAQKTEAVNQFVFMGRLPGLNDYVNACRSHWSRGAAMKRQVEQDIIWYILAARGEGMLRPATGPVRLYIEWHESDMRRDVDNIVSAKKFILDAMQRADIIPDDNRHNVKQIADIIIDDTKDYVVVQVLDAE